MPDTAPQLRQGWYEMKQDWILGKASAEIEDFFILELNLAKATFLILKHLPSNPSIVTIKLHCTIHCTLLWIVLARVVLKGEGVCVLAKLGTGFVANNPLSPPPLLLLLHPYCCNCTNMQSIIGTALRCCGNNPPNILRLRRGLKSWLADFFIHWQPKFPTKKIRPSPQPFSHGLFVIDSRGIFWFYQMCREKQ